MINYFQKIENEKSQKEEEIFTETLNILLLGQTGCGKSTFINSFFNYMRHNNLERLCDF